MNRLYRHIFTMGLATACYGQPAPPAPPAPAAPPTFDIHPIPPMVALDVDFGDIEDKVRTAEDRMRSAEDNVRAAMDRVRQLSDDGFAFSAIGPMMLAQVGTPAPRPATAPMPPMPPFSRDSRIEIRTARAGSSGRDSEDRLYRRGSEYLDKREWEKAIDAFDQVIDKKGAKADGAFYWKAYGLSKLGRRDQALAAIVELRKTYPNSRWLNDAKALEAEVQQAGGQGPSPENQSDEDLKLFAINSLMNSDPERALPLLEKILQKNSSPKLRERALFVLAQSRTPKSNEIVTQFARGGGNPDLQQKAVEYLGIYGGKDNLQTLSDIYNATNDLGLKRTILRSFISAHDKDRLLAAAKTEQNSDLRRDAIQYLGSLGAYQELAQLYTTEQSPEVKESIIQSLAHSGNVEKVIEIARTEKDPKLRTTAIHVLGSTGKSKTADALVSLYGSESDRNNKEQIIHALGNQGSAKELVEIARKEQDPNLKREAVRRLASMKSKEGTDFLMELLNK